MEQLIRESLLEAQRELDEFVSRPETVHTIVEATRLCAEALKHGKKILSCGNGGSLCDATHFAEELTGRYRNNRRPFPAIAMNDAAYLTCTANDFSFSEVFSRYVEGVAQEGDVLLAITTSGHSENISLAVRKARQMGVRILLLTSDNGNDLIPQADVAICAPRAAHSDRIQEIHIKVIHILIQSIEKALGVDK